MVIFLREAITNYVDLYWKLELIEINWSLWEKQNKQMCNWLELRREENSYGRPALGKQRQSQLDNPDVYQKVKLLVEFTDYWNSLHVPFDQ